MKKIISFILLSCMLLNITTAFAENNVNTTEDSNIINTDVLSDENVLYKVIQENSEFSLFGWDNHDKNETTADFDVVMGFDMSYSMYEYDINGDKQWMDSFKAISEQAPDNTRYSVLTTDEDSFTDDLDLSISAVQERQYNGTDNVISLLDDSMNIFDETSDKRNKVVIVTTHDVSDVSLLEDKLKELKENSIIPFIFVLNTNTDILLNIDGVYQCATDFDLRLALADLYLSFSEFDMAKETLQTYASNDENVLKSDFKERHLFKGSEIDGLKMASILNMYKCVPLKAVVKNSSYKSYDLIDGFTPEEREWFIEANNSELGSMPGEFADTWNQIFEDIQNDKKVVVSDKSDIEYLILKNMKRRFPILVQVKNNDDNYIWKIANEYNVSTNKVKLSDNTYMDISNVEKIFDTYEYILNTVYSATNLYDTVDWQNMRVTIDTIYPNNYNLVLGGDNATVHSNKLPDDTDEDEGIDYVVNRQTLHTTITKERNFVLASQATFDGGFPDVYGVNKGYRIKFYHNINSSYWYADYLFKATNIGMISGDGFGNFDPDSKITYSAFFRMLFDSVHVNYDDITGGPSTGDDKGKYWAYNYLMKAKKLGFLNDMSTENWAVIQDYGDTHNVSRGQAAKWICDLLLKKRDEVNSPTLLYDYTNIENYRSHEFENYEDMFLSNGQKHIYYDEIMQLYMNDIMNGIVQTENNITEYRMYPDKELTRAEICVLIVKCLFNMDENIPLIEANIENNITTEPIKLNINEREKNIKSVTFNSDNEIVYDITFDTEGKHKYIIQTLGELTTSKLSATLEGADKAELKEGSSDEKNKLKENVVYSLYANKGDTYTLKINREGTDDIGLKIIDMNIPQSLDFHHQKGENGQHKYIYSNNREGITTGDLADNAEDPRLIFCQNNLTTGTYTMMMEHRNDTDNDLYIDIQFYDPNSNSEMTITKYGDAKLGNFSSPTSYACIPAYADFRGLSVGRIRKQVNDVDDSDKLIIQPNNMSEKLNVTEHNFQNDNSIWISSMYRNDKGKYPSITPGEYIYTMLEFEVKSEIGITVSVAAYRKTDDFDNRFKNYNASQNAPYNAPYHKTQCVKGISDFKPQTIADLDFIIDTDTELNKAQRVIISNPFKPQGNVLDRWKTHMNPQAEETAADETTESDIMPLYYYDYYSNKMCIFDTKHDMYEFKTFDESHLIETNTEGEDLRKSSNYDYACNLGNYGVQTTYKINAQNITDEDRYFCYRVKKESNLFFTVKDESGKYMKFNVDGTQTEAICSGEVSGKGDLYPITEGDILVSLPSGGDEKDDITEIQILVPAHTTKIFYIEEVLVTCANGSIPTQMIIR